MSIAGSDFGAGGASLNPCSNDVNLHAVDDNYDEEYRHFDALSLITQLSHKQDHAHSKSRLNSGPRRIPVLVRDATSAHVKPTVSSASVGSQSSTKDGRSPSSHRKPITSSGSSSSSSSSSVSAGSLSPALAVTTATITAAIPPATSSTIPIGIQHISNPSAIPQDSVYATPNRRKASTVDKRAEGALNDILSTPTQRSTPMSKKSSTTVKSKPTVTFCSPDRSPARSGLKSQRSSPEKKSKQQQQQSPRGVLTPSADKTTVTVVTPGPLVLDAPPSINHPKASSSTSRTLSRPTDSTTSPVVTAEKLSANKAAKRAASLFGSPSFLSPRKYSYSTVTSAMAAPSGNSKKSQISTPKKSLLPKAAPAAARNTRIRDLVSPTYTKTSSQPNSKSPASTSVSSSSARTKELRSIKTDLKNIDMCSSLFDGMDSELPTPYTVASGFSKDYSLDADMHKSRSFDSALSPVSRVSEQLSPDSGLIAVPRLSSEEVNDRLPKHNTHHRVTTSHMRMMHDRYREDTADAVVSSTASAFKSSNHHTKDREIRVGASQVTKLVPSLMSTADAVPTVTSARSDINDNRSNRIQVSRVISSDEEEADHVLLAERSTSFQPVSPDSTRPQDEIEVEHQQRHRQQFDIKCSSSGSRRSLPVPPSSTSIMADCNLSSVDPSRCTSPKSLVSNLSWTLGRETPVSFLFSEPYSSFQDIDDTTFKSSRGQSFADERRRSMVSSEYTVIEGDGSIGTLDRAMLIDEDNDEREEQEPEVNSGVSEEYIENVDEDLRDDYDGDGNRQGARAGLYSKSRDQHENSSEAHATVTDVNISDNEEFDEDIDDDSIVFNGL